MTPETKKIVGVATYVGLTGLFVALAYRAGKMSGQSAAGLDCATGVNPCAAQAIRATLADLKPYAPVPSNPAIVQATTAPQDVYVLWVAYNGAKGHPLDDSDVIWQVAGWGSYAACVNKKIVVYDELYPVFLVCIRKSTDPELVRGRSVGCVGPMTP